MVEHKIKPVLKEVLKQKHVPFHKVLNSRPQSAKTGNNHAQSFSGKQRVQNQSHYEVELEKQILKREFSMFKSEENLRKSLKKHEQMRKSKIIGQRIQTVNKKDNHEHITEQQIPKGDLKYESPQRQKKLVDKILNLEEKRIKVTDNEQHHLHIRGGNTDWRNKLRDYNDQQKILIRQSELREEERLKNALKSVFPEKPQQYREQEVQTIKSVFRPEVKDESLSAIFPVEE